MSKRIIAASTSTLHSSSYLAYLMPAIESLFHSCKELLFIPYARPGGITHDAYTKNVAQAFQPLGIRVSGIHEYTDPMEAIRKAEALFTGGGNTFVLVQQLYENGLLPALREVILKGTPYLGTSAGSNICGVTMQTTNDMPIVYPPGFKTLGVLPFNINAHYVDPVEGDTHMGETREMRIKEFHSYNPIPVIGLREGSWVEAQGTSIQLKGTLKARIFEQGKAPYELEPNTAITIR